MNNLVFVTLLALTAPAIASQELAAKNNCLACHAVDKKLVGPSFKSVSERYKGDATAQERLAKKIQKGGSGQWGAIPMPGNPKITDQEAKALAKWVLGQ